MADLNHIAYRAARRNVAALLGDRPEAASLEVPQCPGWTVRDLLGHLVEVCRCVLDNRGSPIDVGVGTPADIADLLNEWDARGAAADRMIANGGRWSGVLVLDSFTHELDLRYVLGEPLPTDHPAFGPAFDVAVMGFGQSLMARELPAVLVSADGVDRVAGHGEPAVTLGGAGFDVFRSLVGRRTEAQIVGLSWSADPAPWLPAFPWGPFTPPIDPVEKTTDS